MMVLFKLGDMFASWFPFCDKHQDNVMLQCAYNTSDPTSEHNSFYNDVGLIAFAMTGSIQCL